MLAELGFLVVAADLDEQALRETMASAPPAGAIIPVRLDAQRPLPFCPCSIDLLLIVHPHSLEVLSRSLGYLRPGGYLIFETFGAQGENWRALPRRGQIADELSMSHLRLAYIERPVPKASGVVTVKGVFRRLSTC
jgi:SAM-dependent methyltransferase